MTDATQSPQLPGRQCQAFQARREAAVALWPTARPCSPNARPAPR